MVVYTPETLPPFAVFGDVPAAAKAALGSTDAELQKALDEATAHLRDLCGWHVAPQLRHVVQAEPRGDMVFLPTLHLVTMHSILHYGTSVSWFTPVRTGRLRVVGTWDLLDIDMTHGHETVPLALRRLTVLMALRAESSRLGVTREQIGQHSASFTLTGPQSAGGMVVLDSEQATLDPYRRVGLP